jgi:hypothetical protein
VIEVDNKDDEIATIDDNQIIQLKGEKKWVIYTLF